MTTNLQTWAGKAVRRLQAKSEFPYIESQVILAFTLKTTREWIVAHPEFELNREQEGELELHLQKLIEGEPLPYITGIQAFYGLDFDVTPGVLIPRPETELLVEEAIHWLEQHPRCRSVLDMGTGSGAIAVTLADRIPDLRVTAADISPAALEVAARNAFKFGVTERIRIVQSDLWQQIEDSFDLITANLPYVPSSTMHTLAVARHEPVLALDGGSDGLEVIRRMLDGADSHIRPGGLILLEIEAGQGESAAAIARAKWPNAATKLITDYSNLPRLITIQAN